MLDFRILGPVEAVEADRTIALGGPLQRAVLAILILRRGEVVTSDRLIDELWGERPPATAPKTLQGYVSRLRRALGADVLLTRGGGYSLAADPEQVDAERFETLTAQGRAALGDGDAAHARELLKSALALWRGQALADLTFTSFGTREAERLEEARLSAREDRIEADLMLGRAAELAAELEALVALHPHRERLRGQLMLALYRGGRQADALEAHRRGRQLLRDDLGLEPGPQLRALEQRILDHDPSLQPRLAVRGPLGRRRPGSLALVGTVLVAAAVAGAAVRLATGSGPPSLPVPANAVAAIDLTSDHVVAAAQVGVSPGPIAFGSGSLWVANEQDETVSRVDPRTLSPQGTISLGATPTAIATTPGATWIVTSGPTATSVSVDRVNPEFDTISRTTTLGDVSPGSGASVSGGDSLWVAPYSGLLSQLSTATGRAVRQIDPNAAPAGVAVGAGATWVSDSDADTVTRIDPTGFVDPIAVGNEPSGIAVGYGGVWVADTGDDTVKRIDPVTRSVTATIPVGEKPTGITVGAGSVWVADSGDGTVTRIDPLSPQVIARITLGGSPQAIVIARGRAWVTVDARAVPAAPANGKTLRLVSLEDVDYIDPARANGPLSWELLYATCAKLLNYPDRSGAAGAELVPEVARSLPTISDGGRTYTFTIRSGFRFSPSSSAPVTAETFKATIERTLDPTIQSPVAGELDDIVGVRAYRSGAARHISGVVARGDTLTIRLVAPEPDLSSRLAQPYFCAVPPGEPADPRGVRDLASAGPYYVSSYAPGQGVVLTRNPNYHGTRPHGFAHIALTVGVAPQRAIAEVESGAADYAVNREVDSSQEPELARRYGAASQAAKHGKPQYFVAGLPALDYLVLNTHRPLFADRRLRQAVNDAVNRTALARTGGLSSTLPERPTANYIPPGVPGFSDVQAYPLVPQLSRARRLAQGHKGATVVLYTCTLLQCSDLAQLLKTELAKIGLRLVVHRFDFGLLFTKLASPSGWDIGSFGYSADYLDPDDFLNLQLSSGTYLPTFEDARFQAKLAAAARLTGTRRYLAYARLADDLARNGAPFVVYGVMSTHQLFSARVGCQSSGVYGTDVAALCIRSGAA